MFRRQSLDVDLAGFCCKCTQDLSPSSQSGWWLPNRNCVTVSQHEDQAGLGSLLYLLISRSISTCVTSAFTDIHKAFHRIWRQTYQRIWKQAYHKSGDRSLLGDRPTTNLETGLCWKMGGGGGRMGNSKKKCQVDAGPWLTKSSIPARCAGTAQL